MFKTLLARVLGFSRRQDPDTPPDEFWAEMQECEQRIRELEARPPSVDILYEALQILKPRLNFDIELEGDPPTSVCLRHSSGMTHYLSFENGLYHDFWTQAAETDLDRSDSLERIVWSAAGMVPPSVYIRAYRWAERHHQIGRHPKTRKVIGVPTNIIENEYSKEFEKTDGIWRRKL